MWRPRYATPNVPPFVVVVLVQYRVLPPEKWKGRIGGMCERTLRAEELAGDVEGLTSHNDDLLTVKQLLGNSAGQATQEVSLAVDDDLYQSESS
jgi:hypothetical protein